MSRPVHFEIHADDPARAIDFYELVLGWSFRQAEGAGSWLISTGPEDRPGIDGWLVRRRGPSPDPAQSQPMTGFVVTMEVKDLETFEHAVINAGGSIAVPRQAIGGIGWLTYVRDTEGNVLGLRQPDPSAG